MKILEMNCPECTEITKIILGGKFDGFIQPGCSHSVKVVFKGLLDQEKKEKE